MMTTAGRGLKVWRSYVKVKGVRVKISVSENNNVYTLA